MDKRERLIQKIRNIAVQTPTRILDVPEKVEGFGSVSYTPPSCSACKKCIEVCEVDALELDASVRLPDYLSAVIPEEGFRSKNRESLISL